MTVAIRPANMDDVEQLSVLMDQYRVYYGTSSDVDQAKAFISERITDKESVIFVAELDGILVGFTQLYPLFSTVQLKRLWLLNDLFVHKDARRRHIGQSLIERAKELCADTSNCGGLLLETEKTNVAGNQLYPKTGFVLNEVTNFYSWSM
mmetsp:Transcript_9508/g.15845  ORF Transcript_9508/g.15845 Transcript_9508/m.15845 type:complete len:150 (+) Transcript_9508:101-550(+)